ncbi:MAG: serine hydrolase domain-containing protein [Chthoniobacteraceae bacterium]
MLLRCASFSTSGYPPYQPEGNPVDAYQSLAESVKHLAPLAPLHAPGAEFEYGGLAMQVAGRMAELATGKDSETLFQEKIARPCAMQNTHFTPVDTKQAGHAPMLGGGARSTLPDYEHLLSMIFHGGVYAGRHVLSASAIREMQADQVRQAHVSPGQGVCRTRPRRKAPRHLRPRRMA